MDARDWRRHFRPDSGRALPWSAARACRRGLILLLLVLAPGLVHAETRVALVIGNADYTSVGRLANPDNDAVLIERTLRQVGFSTVIAQHNLGKTALERALRDFARQARGADVALVYYSGHGFEAGGTNYLVPVDATLASADDVDFEAVPLDLVLSAVSGASRLKLVILDACRNNPFAPRMAAGSKAVGERGLARIEPEGDVLVAYAAKAGTTALDGTVNGNSPFAKALAADIVVVGLDVRLMFGKVRDDVLAATGQKQEPFVYGSLGGAAFYFVPPSDGVAPTPVPIAPAPVDPKALELAYWNSVAASNDAAQLQSYLDQFPNGLFAAVARAKIAALNRPAQVASLPPPNVAAAPTTATLVQEAVVAAQDAARRARERAAAARNVQANAEQAAQRAAAALSGYAIITGTYPNGDTYRWEGQVADNQPNGVGISYATSGSGRGDRYEGAERNGLAEGLGVYYFASGDSYAGEYRANFKAGVGIYTGASHRSYSEVAGEFSNDHPNGYCIFRFKDGTAWIGAIAGSEKESNLNGYGEKLDARGFPTERGYFEAGVLNTALTH